MGPKRQWMLGTVVVLWALSAVSGFTYLSLFQHRAGDEGMPKENVPASSAVKVLMFLHPRCSCSHASVHELQRILLSTKTGESSPRVHAQIFLFQPDETDSDAWDGSAMISELKLFPSVEICNDPRGRIAASHGIATSGHVLIYDKEGNLKFSGGITQRRAHEGENTNGILAVQAILQVSNEIVRRPVFGCSIF
ncbi:MAG: hypothetical protein ACI9R3_002432 [Verrucomicrobiales bacterium]|jgi:hypothetical protein